METRKQGILPLKGEECKLIEMKRVLLKKVKLQYYIPYRLLSQPSDVEGVCETLSGSFYCSRVPKGAVSYTTLLTGQHSGIPSVTKPASALFQLVKAASNREG